MSNSAQVDGPITVSGEGVSVTKEFADDEEFPIPTIRFVVENEREETVTVTVIEEVPEEFAIDDLGFHPDYNGEQWTTEDDHAEFEYDVPAGEDVKTLYAVRIDDEGRAGEFMTEPTLDVPPLDEEEADAAAESEETEAETEDTTEDESAETASSEDGDDEAGEEKASLDIDIDSEAAQASGDGDASGDTSGDVPTIELDSVDDVGESDVPAAAVGPESGTVVERLVAELQRTDVDAESKAILREQLDVGLPSEADARIERLQNRIEDLAAYTDALEDFLDEEGTAQQVIEDYKTQIDALREDVADIRHLSGINGRDIDGLAGDLSTLEDHVGDVEERLDEVATHADTIEDSLQATDDHIEDVEADLESAEEDVADNAEEIESVEGRVDDLEDETDTIDEDLEDVEGRVSEAEVDIDDLETRADEVEGDIASVQSVAGDNADEIAELDEYVRDVESDLEEDVESIEEDVADIQDDVDEFEEWRDQLGEMFQ